MDEAATQEDGMVFVLCVAVRFQSDNYIDAGELDKLLAPRASFNATSKNSGASEESYVGYRAVAGSSCYSWIHSIQEHELRTWHTAPMEQEYFPSLEKCFSGEANLM